MQEIQKIQKIQKIDTHLHFWQYRAADFPWISPALMPQLQRDFLPEDALPVLDAAQVQAAIAVQARSSAVETDFLLQLAAKHPQVLGVIGWADLGTDGLGRQLEPWIAQPAFKGLRHILQDEPDVGQWVSQSALDRNLKILQKQKLVYEVLVFHHQLPSVLKFCGRHDNHWLVLDHAAKPPLANQPDKAALFKRWAAGIKQLAAMPHMLCKLSGLVTETDWQNNRLNQKSMKDIWTCFDTVLEAFGPSRLMYGSDWPVCTLAAPYAQVHGETNDWVKSRLKLNMPEQQAFWAETAKRCYNL